MTAARRPGPVTAIGDLTTPVTWAAVPPEPRTEDDWTAEVAALLSDEEGVRGPLAGVLRRRHAALVEGTHHVVAVWVPDPSTPIVAGYLTVDLLVGDDGVPGSRADHRVLVETDRSGPVVLERHVDEVDVLAGPALRLRETVAVRAGRRSWRRVTQHHVVYTVFPPGSTDAIELTFVTNAPDLVGRLEDDAEEIALTLRVDVGTAP